MVIISRIHIHYVVLIVARYIATTIIDTEFIICGCRTITIHINTIIINLIPLNRTYSYSDAHIISWRLVIYHIIRYLVSRSAVSNSYTLSISSGASKGGRLYLI